MNKKPAFTLIELMVSVTIMLLLTGMAMVTMGNFNDRQKAQGVRSEIRSMLELTRNYAQTMQYPEGAPSVPNYYKFSIGTSKVVSIDACFSTDCLSSYPFTSKDYSAEGVTMDAVNICFKPFDAVLSACNIDPVIDRTIFFNTNYSLTVKTNGQISESP